VTNGGRLTLGMLFLQSQVFLLRNLLPFFAEATRQD
jgi:hypothetical protein